jgi:hypothetical protein
MARLFTVASDQTPCAMISTARERLVLVSPGLSRLVAAALAERIRQDGGPGVIAVILDVDPEVCRLGYGEIEAIDLLRPALAARGLDLQMQKGVRIGLAMADAEVLIYSPTPMLLEAGSNSEEKPNAIRISNTSAPDIAAACGAGEATVSAPRPEVGITVASQRVVEETKADLKENPPRQFNLVRLERIFNYKLEFVEFSLSDFRLNKRTVSLPAELLGLVEEDLRDRLHNTFRIFEGGVPFEFEFSDPASLERKLKISEKWLGKQADKLRKEYFIPLGSSSYGNLILKRLKAKFQDDVVRLKALVDLYADKVRASISEKVCATRDDLIKALFPRIKAAPPASWLQRSVDGKLSDETLMQRLEEEVDQAFAGVDQDYKPTLTCLFKGVNYETITSDKNFRERIEDYFGSEEASRLLSEYDASRAQQQSPSL